MESANRNFNFCGIPFDMMTVPLYIYAHAVVDDMFQIESSFLCEHEQGTMYVR